jgi:hypothetical protein
MLMMVGVPTACQVNAVGRRSEAARHVIPGAAISGRPVDVRVTLEAATSLTWVCIATWYVTSSVQFSTSICYCLAIFAL